MVLLTSGITQSQSAKNLIVASTEKAYFMRVNLWRRPIAGQRKLPDFLIIGAQRSGTSTLYQHLARHPSVKRAARKEVHSFDTYYDRGLDWYRAQFPFSGVTGE